MTTSPNTLETGEEKFQHLISQAPVLIATFNGPSFIVETVNKTALDIWGKSYDEVINKPLFQSSPELEDGLKDLLTGVLITGEPFISNEIPVQLKRPGKPDTAYFNFVYQPLRDTNNNIYGIILIGTEITETLNARKLRESGELFNRTILESSPDCLKVLDLEGNIKYMNRNGLCLMEVDDFDTLKNKSWITMWGENEGLARASINQALKGNIAQFSAMRPTIKGTPKYWDVVVSPIHKPGEPIQQIISVSRDITEAKKAEQQIKEARELFEVTLHNVPSAVYHLNSKGEILYLNETAAQQMGYDSIEEVLAEKDVYQFRKKLDERFDILNEQGEPLGADESCSSISLKTGKPAEVTIKFIDKKKNSSFWLLTKSVPLLNNNGEITNVFTACTDITKQKESEIELKLSEEKYRGLFETMNQGFCIVEMIYDENNKPFDLRYLETNPIFNTQSGLHDVVNKTIKELVPNIENSWFEIYDKVLKTGEPVSFTQKTEAMNSWFDVHASRLGDAGSRKVAILFTNITEQKNAQDAINNLASHFKLATDSANVGTWSLNIKTQELEWSALHKKMWGYDENRTDLTFEDWHIIILPEDKALAFQRVEEARVNHTLYEVEYRIKRPNDNVIRWMRSFGQYYYNEVGEAITLTGISLDVTEQKSFTEELEKKVTERTTEIAIKSEQLQILNKTLDANNLALENANAELQSFTYIASHDLQEPLRTIKLFSKRIVEAEEFSDKTKNYFNFIIDASERMRNLIVSLIDFSRTEKSELNIVPCNLNTIVEESKSDLHVSITEKNAIIQSETLPTVTGMHIQLLQLFTNIIGNAIKYSKPAVAPHIKITVTTVAGETINHPSAVKQTNYYAIKIADNGIGFEKEYETKIFEVFQRLHGRTEYKGTGIGLAIVKKIAINHNGFIIAEGVPDIGATFTIYLPTA